MASTDTTQSSVRLHILKLHENPIDDDGSYTKFDAKWVIDDQNGTSSPQRIDNRLKQTDNDDTARIAPGDVIFFPELLTGAGEFEGVRIAGERITQQTDDGDYNCIPLYKAGVETPVFPSTTLQTVACNAKRNLRPMYEDTFETVLRYQGDVSMIDLFGGESVVEGFWENPDMERRRGSSHACTGVLRIPLHQCLLLPNKDS